MNDDLTILASAYLDGEATPDERVRVEADPSLLDEVERLRTARTALLDPMRFDRPGDDARETAITAALTAWDLAALDLARSTPGSRPAARRPLVVPFVRRHAYTRWLGAAAAVVAVAALGVLVAQTRGGDNDEDSAAIEAPAETVATGEALLDSTADQPERSAAPSDTEAISGDVAAEAAGGADADTADTSAAAELPADLAPSAGSELQALPEANLETVEELATFAAEAKQLMINRSVPDAAVCSGDGVEAPGSIDEYVATGTYRGRPVVIGIDADRDRAIAVDADTCEIVAETPLP